LEVGYPVWKMPLFKAFAKNKQKIFLLRMDSHSEETLKKVKKNLGKEKLYLLRTIKGLIKNS